MDLITCNPYIRFANSLRFEYKRGPSKTYDCRLLYTLKGSARIHLEGIEHFLKRGSLVLFQPGTEYLILPDEAVTLAVFDFDYTQDYSKLSEFNAPRRLEMFRAEEAHEVIHFTDIHALNQPLFLENVRHLEQELLSVIAEFQQKKLYFREKSSAMFKNILFDIVRYLQLGDTGNSTLDQVVHYIDTHTTGRISNAQIGQALNYNPNYLNRLMIRHTGMTLHQYILQRRLAQASTLLQTTNRPINEIALELGFNSLSHFSGFFKKETGTTPMEYRKSGTI